MNELKIKQNMPKPEKQKTQRVAETHNEILSDQFANTELIIGREINRDIVKSVRNRDECQ